MNGSVDNNTGVGWLGKAWGMLCGSFSGRGGGGAAFPTPKFDVDLGASIVPIAGTAGTFARASTAYYFSSASTLASVASNNPAIGAKGPDAATGTGIFISRAVKNYLL